MGPVQIVVGFRCVDHLCGLTRGWEQVLAEAVVPKSALGPLHKAVLDWLARCDVVPFNAPLLLSGQHGVRGQFRAVGADDQAGIATPLHDGIK